MRTEGACAQGKMRPTCLMERIAHILQLFLLMILGVVTAAAANPPVRIMPLGDSITFGFDPDSVVQGGYRTELYQALSSAGYNVDFVGTLQDSNPPLALGDPDYEGHGGYRIDEIDSGLDGWLAQLDDPDVVLLLIGTNDFWQNFDPNNAINRLENLIAHIATQRPFAKIVVASLLLFGADPTIDSQIQTFNSNIPGVVTHQVSLGHQVSFVNLRSCCGPSDLSSDQVHPNLTGYTKIGDAWVPAVTNVISPLGTTNPPAIAHVKGQVDLKHVLVTFSKPVADTATTLGNFSLSGGVTISQASLDAVTKRTITLTTSAQTPNTTYTLTVSGVQDRTAQHNVIASGSTATFQSGPVAEAVDYTLAYSLKVPNEADYNTTGVDYEVDNHASIGAFSRVAYYLELRPLGGGPLQYLWASMDAFTVDASRIGVPTIQTGAFFQQMVTNLNVRSSVAGIFAGDGLSGGNLEFWRSDYGPANTANVAGASPTLYDWGDAASSGDPAGYGSMQLHNSAATQTLFAFNGWGGAGLINDLGIGNSPGTQPDWTLAQNARCTPPSCCRCMSCRHRGRVGRR